MASTVNEIEREVTRTAARLWDAGKDTVDIAIEIWGTRDAEPEAERLILEIRARRRANRAAPWRAP